MRIATYRSLHRIEKIDARLAGSRLYRETKTLGDRGTDEAFDFGKRFGRKESAALRAGAQRRGAFPIRRRAAKVECAIKAKLNPRMVMSKLIERRQPNRFAPALPLALDHPQMRVRLA